MKRLAIVACVCSFGLCGVALAQPYAGPAGSGDARSPVKSVAGPAWNNDVPVPPAPSQDLPPQTAPSLPATVAAPTSPRTFAAPLAPASGSPGEEYATREARAHEMHAMQAQAAEDSVHRAAVARADQRMRRLESQRWFGVSNTRPSANIDPYDGDYSAYWASNYPFYPQRWLGSGEPWGYFEGQ